MDKVSIGLWAYSSYSQFCFVFHVLLLQFAFSLSFVMSLLDAFVLTMINTFNFILPIILLIILLIMSGKNVCPQHGDKDMLYVLQIAA